MRLFRTERATSWILPWFLLVSACGGSAEPDEWELNELEPSLVDSEGLGGPNVFAEHPVIVHQESPNFAQRYYEDRRREVRSFDLDPPPRLQPKLAEAKRYWVGFGPPFLIDGAIHLFECVKERPLAYALNDVHIACGTRQINIFRFWLRLNEEPSPRYVPHPSWREPLSAASERGRLSIIYVLPDTDEGFIYSAEFRENPNDQGGGPYYYRVTYSQNGESFRHEN